MAEPQCLTIKYEPQGGELDAEADVDILKSSETRTEMKLSADQIHQYEVDARFASTGIRVAFMQKEFRAVLQLVKDIDNRITILIERGGAPIIFGTERKGDSNAHLQMECVLATVVEADPNLSPSPNPEPNPSPGPNANPDPDPNPNPNPDPKPNPDPNPSQVVEADAGFDDMGDLFADEATRTRTRTRTRTLTLTLA